MEILFVLAGIGILAALVGGGSGGGASSDIVAGDGPEPTEDGTPGPDLLTGTFFDDVVYGRAGNDTVLGGAGNDTLGGGTGRDFLRGGDGDDTLRGGADGDTLEGAIGNDFLQGDGGNDLLRGGPGADYLTGNLGEDTLEGGPGDDTLVGLDAPFAEVPASDGDTGDVLEGWGGSDFIVMGRGDEAWGEFATSTADGAADTFVSGTWIGSGDTAPVVHDYDPTVDRLVLYYDATETPAPVV